uniref:Uncharacterized protein n=1 Tax=Solanum lycopersicum TaxID=4081 RepID=K4BHR0_SOLLC
MLVSSCMLDLLLSDRSVLFSNLHILIIYALNLLILQGSKCEKITRRAVPLSSHVEAVMRVVACAHILQAYCLSESCAGTFVSLPTNFIYSVQLVF